MAEEDHRTMLEEEFPPAALYSRTTATGQRLTYIRTVAVIDRLNQVYGHGGWSFEVLEHQSAGSPPDIIVRGRLGVPGATIIQYGFAPASQHLLTYGDRLKAASSDSLVRCSSLLGIGLYLRRRQVEQNGVSTQEPLPPGAEPARLPLTSRQYRFLQCRAEEKGITPHQLEEHCLLTFGVGLQELLRPQASELIEALSGEHFVLNCAA